MSNCDFVSERSRQNMTCSLNSSQEIKIPSLKDPIKLDGMWLALHVIWFQVILRFLI